MFSRSRLFSKLAKDIDATGNLKAAGISTNVSFGPTVYDSIGLLPYVGNETGDQAYVSSNNRLYLWDSVGWYNVALINRAPSILSVQDSDGNTTPFELSPDGIVTTITISAVDSDGETITYSATGDSDFINGMGSISQAGNEFTITPFGSDSATAESGTITFKATDGINISSSINTFTLSFAWVVDLTQVTYDSVSFSVVNQDTNPYKIAFNENGTKMYMVGASTDAVYQYTLGTAYDLSTASYDSVSFSVSSQASIPTSIAFNENGTKMYIVGRQGPKVFQYTLGTGFDLSTASYDSVSLDVSAQEVLIFQRPLMTA